MLPEQKHARKVVWDAIDVQGRRVIDQVFPRNLRRRVNDHEMKIELVNGSIWQCVGSDNYDRLIGANPVGVIFSEYAVAKPAAWDFIRPILAENGGWAVFIFTPRGRNHGFRLFDMAREHPNWFAELLTVEDTGAVPLEAVAEERRAGMPEEMIQQEFYCSFDSALLGAYYGQMIAELDRKGRLDKVPWDPALPVQTAWDLGVADSTVIWFAQVSPSGEIRLIDYYESSGQGLQHYVKVLAEKGYIYGTHYAPHDIKIREMGTGKSRLEVAKSLGLSLEPVANLPVADGIQAVRDILPRCWFDAEKCGPGIEALRSYRREYDENLHTFKPSPLHDWASHAADAFRYLAVGHKRLQYIPRDGYGREDWFQGRSRSGGLAATYGMGNGG
jgi:hypothetical protein